MSIMAKVITIGVAPIRCAYGFFGKMLFQRMIIESIAAEHMIATGTMMIAAQVTLRPEIITAKATSIYVTELRDANSLSSELIKPIAISATVARPNRGARCTLS